MGCLEVGGYLIHGELEIGRSSDGNLFGMGKGCQQKGTDEQE